MQYEKDLQDQQWSHAELNEFIEGQTAVDELPEEEFEEDYDPLYEQAMREKDAKNSWFYWCFGITSHIDPDLKDLVSRLLFLIVTIAPLLPTSIFAVLELANMMNMIRLTLLDSGFKSKRRVVNNLTILEDLAVSHIVSDKTGTLTQNKMIFRGIGVGVGLQLFGVPGDVGIEQKDTFQEDDKVLGSQVRASMGSAIGDAMRAEMARKSFAAVGPRPTMMSSLGRRSFSPPSFSGKRPGSFMKGKGFLREGKHKSSKEFLSEEEDGISAEDDVTHAEAHSSQDLVRLPLLGDHSQIGNLMTDTDTSSRSINHKPENKTLSDNYGALSHNNSLVPSSPHPEISTPIFVEGSHTARTSEDKVMSSAGSSKIKSQVDDRSFTTARKYLTVNQSSKARTTEYKHAKQISRLAWRHRYYLRDQLDPASFYAAHGGRRGKDLRNLDFKLLAFYHHKQWFFKQKNKGAKESDSRKSSKDPDLFHVVSIDDLNRRLDYMNFDESQFLNALLYEPKYGLGVQGVYRLLTHAGRAIVEKVAKVPEEWRAEQLSLADKIDFFYLQSVHHKVRPQSYLTRRVVNREPGNVSENQKLYTPSKMDGNAYLDDYEDKDRQAFQAVKCRDLLLSLCLNNNVRVCYSATKNFKTSSSTILELIKDKRYYFATSPDEMAFSAFATEMGMILTKKTVGAASSASKGFDGSKPKISEFLDLNESDNILYNLIVAPGNTFLSYAEQQHQRDQHPEQRNIEVLQVLPFDSLRKRMSVIVRLPDRDPKGYVRVLSKGADSAILPHCLIEDASYNIYKRYCEEREWILPTYSRGKAHLFEQRADKYDSPMAVPFDYIFDEETDREAAMRLINEDLDVYANQGWRTLCFSQRLMKETEFEEWHFRWRKLEEEEKMVKLSAEADLMNALRSSIFSSSNSIASPSLAEEALARITKAKELMMQVIEEKSNENAVFEYLGCTALEDVLQDDLPEALAAFRHAGILTWVLTGDKVETAVAISLSCGLITPATVQVIVRDLPQLISSEINGGMSIAQYLFAQMTEMGTVRRNHEIKSSGVFTYYTKREQDEMRDDPAQIEFALVIDGDSLDHICSSNDKKTLVALIPFLKRFKTVVACRVTPSQKADLTVLAQIMDLLQKEYIDEKLENRLPPLAELLKDPGFCSRARKEGKTVLAIGDGANDVGMLKQASIGIGMCGVESSLAAQISDLSIEKFADLVRLVFGYGHDAQRIFSLTWKLAIWRTGILTGPMLWQTLVNGAGFVERVFPKRARAHASLFSVHFAWCIFCACLGLERCGHNYDSLYKYGTYYRENVLMFDADEAKNAKDKDSATAQKKARFEKMMQLQKEKGQNILEKGGKGGKKEGKKGSKNDSDNTSYLPFNLSDLNVLDYSWFADDQKFFSKHDPDVQIEAKPRHGKRTRFWFKFFDFHTKQGFLSDKMLVIIFFYTVFWEGTILFFTHFALLTDGPTLGCDSMLSTIHWWFMYSLMFATLLVFVVWADLRFITWWGIVLVVGVCFCGACMYPVMKYEQADVLWEGKKRWYVQVRVIRSSF